MKLTTLIIIIVLCLLAKLYLSRIPSCNEAKVQEYLYTSVFPSSIGGGLMWVYRTDKGNYVSKDMLNVGDKVCQ